METMPQKVNKKYGTKTEIGPRVKIPVSVYKRFTFKCNNTKRVDRFIKEKLEHKEEYYKIELQWVQKTFKCVIDETDWNWLKENYPDQLEESRNGEWLFYLNEEQNKQYEELLEDEDQEEMMIDDV